MTLSKALVLAGFEAHPPAPAYLGDGTLRWYHLVWQDTGVYQQIQGFLLMHVASLRARHFGTRYRRQMPPILRLGRRRVSDLPTDGRVIGSTLRPPRPERHSGRGIRRWPASD